MNEAFNDNGTIRSTAFSNVLGEAYIGVAFRAARLADPAAKLYINDYNLDNAGWGKVTAMVTKVNQWIGQGIPIDGIGEFTSCYLHPLSPMEKQMKCSLVRSRWGGDWEMVPK